MKFSLTVCTPSSGQCRTQFAFSLAGFVTHYTQVPVYPEVTEQSISFLSMEGTGVSANREKMVKKFLATDATHMLFIDDDMGFNPNALHILASRRLPIVGCNYRVRTPPAPFMAARDGKEIRTTKESTGVEEVDYMGFGFCLLERQVLESVESPRFMIKWMEAADDYSTEDSQFFFKTPFKRYIDHDASKVIWHCGNIHYTWADDYSNMNKILKIV